MRELVPFKTEGPPLRRRHTDNPMGTGVHSSAPSYENFSSLQEAIIDRLRLQLQRSALCTRLSPLQVHHKRTVNRQRFEPRSCKLLSLLSSHLVSSPSPPFARTPPALKAIKTQCSRKRSRVVCPRPLVLGVHSAAGTRAPRANESDCEWATRRSLLRPAAGVESATVSSAIVRLLKDPEDSTVQYI